MAQAETGSAFWLDLEPITNVCREHYEQVGFGADYVDGLFR